MHPGHIFLWALFLEIRMPFYHSKFSLKLGTKSDWKNGRKGGSPLFMHRSSASSVQMGVNDISDCKYRWETALARKYCSTFAVVLYGSPLLSRDSVLKTLHTNKGVLTDKECSDCGIEKWKWNQLTAIVIATKPSDVVRQTLDVVRKQTVVKDYYLKELAGLLKGRQTYNCHYLTRNTHHGSPIISVQRSLENNYKWSHIPQCTLILKCVVFVVTWSFVIVHTDGNQQHTF